MKRPEKFKDIRPANAPRRILGGVKAGLLRKSRLFARDEDGALIIFTLFMFTLMMMAAGLSFDLMRYETHRGRLQATIDRAVLAAASLNQTRDPQTVVEEYFAAAGMTDFLDSVVVVEGISSRKVTATASINIPLHHGDFKIQHIAGESIENGDHVNVLRASAEATAEESIGNVEISMVLDVSGSMNSYGRLNNLKSAAKDFLDTVYDAAEPDAVSTSVIPYATQVNAGSVLLSNWSRSSEHEFSHCVNFKSSDFETATLPLSTELEQTVHFDPWTTESTYFDLGEPMIYWNCEVDADRDGDQDREIMAWSTSKADLKTYIDNMVGDGNTSTDVGTKWGAALLDPSTRQALSNMISGGHVNAELAGRPFDYNSSEAMKILVVMTDGDHTNQYYMDDYRDGMSFVWKYVSGGVTHYSIWYDGEGSTPIVNPSGNYSYCDDWYNGSCYDWDYDDNPEFWFHARNYNQNYNSYSWRKTPYGGSDAVQMTWLQVWNEIPPEYFSDEVLWEMGSLGFTERNAFEYSVSAHGHSTKNTRFDAICDAVKDNNVIVFTIGLEVSNSNSDRLEDCASSDSHYFDVENIDIGAAFQSIATQINQLRLTQ